MSHIPRLNGRSRALGILPGPSPDDGEGGILDMLYLLFGLGCAVVGLLLGWIVTILFLSGGKREGREP